MQMTTIEKGWGYERVFANTSDYCGKILHFVNGGKTSMHFHAKKAETFYVLSGKYTITTIDTKTAQKNTVLISAGEKYDVKQYVPHQIAVVEGGDIVEVSTHDDASDSYRVEEGSTQINNTNMEQPMKKIFGTNLKAMPVPVDEKQPILKFSATKDEAPKIKYFKKPQHFCATSPVNNDVPKKQYVPKQNNEQVKRKFAQYEPMIFEALFGGNHNNDTLNNFPHFAETCETPENKSQYMKQPPAEDAQFKIQVDRANKPSCVSPSDDDELNKELDDELERFAENLDRGYHLFEY